VIFLKLTRKAKTLFTRFGWLFAELAFVFLGLYGAFLLERQHDDKIDVMRKRQILQALVDEFEGYSQEFSEASASIDEVYAEPFFSAYASQEKPFPQPIEAAALGSVDTGIWEAMLQSGGIDVLEVEDIQRVQGFFKKMQDFLDLFSRFETLTTAFIMPEMDQNASFFYEEESPQLRSQYGWYVNQLFALGTTLRELSEESAATHEFLKSQLEKMNEPDE
jgi:hypothetical protein